MALPPGPPGYSRSQADSRFGTRKLAAPLATSSAAIGALPTAVAARTFREYPTWDKKQTALLPFASQSAPSILGMVMVDMRGWPGALDNVYLFYSTDHGTDSATTGIYLITMSHPTGTNMVDRGKVLGGGALQPEAPQVWLDWDAGLIRFLVSVNTGVTNSGEAQSSQTTVMYTSATGLTAGSFTLVGTTMAKELLRPGVPVTEYPRLIARIGTTMYAYTVDGGGAFALWYSTQGGLPGTWFTSGGRILNLSDQICTLDGYDIQWLAKLNSGAVMSQRGQLWWCGAITGPAAGVEGFALSELYTAPLRPDLRGFSAAPVMVTPPVAPWEADRRFGSLGSAFQYDTGVYLPYRTAEKNTDVGLMILNQGA